MDILPYLTRDGRKRRYDKKHRLALTWTLDPNAESEKVISFFESAALGKVYVEGMKAASDLRDRLNRACKGHWEIHQAWLAEAEGDVLPKTISEDKARPWMAILFENRADMERFKAETQR